MFNNLVMDFRRSGDSFGERCREMMLNPGMWAVVAYRYGQWVRSLPVPRVLRWPFSLGAIVFKLWTQITSTIEISALARIGPGLYIPHAGTITVAPGSVLGRNCTICHCVTIAHRRGGKEKTRTGTPKFGDRVYIGPGSAIIGPITIGDDALIGVGAIVIGSVPARAVVAGNPAKVVSNVGSFDMIQYPGMEQDPARLASLALLSSVPVPDDRAGNNGHTDEKQGINQVRSQYADGICK